MAEKLTPKCENIYRYSGEDGKELGVKTHLIASHIRKCISCLQTMNNDSFRQNTAEQKRVKALGGKLKRELGIHNP